MKNIVYRITSPDSVEGGGICYTRCQQDADILATVVVRNGYKVKVERLKLSQVPTNEIHFVL